MKVVELFRCVYDGLVEMGFRAKRVGKRCVFSGIASDENAYTIVIGDNGCGKTQLLVDICNYYQKCFADVAYSLDATVYSATKDFMRHPTDYNWERVVGEYGRSIPRKLICASTSQFEKFSHDWRMRKDFVSKGFYSYIGSKPYLPDQLPSTRIASTALQQLLMRDTYDHRRQKAINSFLNSFGFRNKLKLTFEASFSTSEIELIKEGKQPELEKQLILKRATAFFEESEILQLLEVVRSFEGNSEIILSLSKNYLNLSALNDVEETHNHSLADVISDLLLADFVRVRDIATVEEGGYGNQSYGYQDAKMRPLAARSSGEQCLFLLFLGIISSIEDNSLICIDEPEISLHPSWQQRFVEILHKAFRQYKGCHFVIATHSPLIVSDIAVKNCEILDMGTNRLTNAREHSFRSSDYQLATLFRNPGNNNEYLITEIIEVLDMICKKGEFGHSVKERAKELMEFKGMQAPDDKVQVLLSILEKTVMGLERQ